MHFLIFLPVVIFVLFILWLFPALRGLMPATSNTGPDHEPGGKYCCFVIGERIGDADGDTLAALNLGAELQRMATGRKLKQKVIDTGAIRATIEANEVIFSLSKYSE